MNERIPLLKPSIIETPSATSSESIEVNPTPEEVWGMFDKLTQGRGFIRADAKLKEGALHTWEARLTEPTVEGYTKQYEYFPASSVMEPTIGVTYYDDNRSVTAETVARYLNGEWVVIS